MSKEIENADRAARASLARLSCDEPTCGYVADHGEFTWGRNLVGSACPNCGSNLLTEEAWAGAQSQLVVALALVGAGLAHVEDVSDE